MAATSVRIASTRRARLPTLAKDRKDGAGKGGGDATGGAGAVRRVLSSAAGAAWVVIVRLVLWSGERSAVTVRLVASISVCFCASTAPPPRKRIRSAAKSAAV